MTLKLHSSSYDLTKFKNFNGSLKVLWTIWSVPLWLIDKLALNQWSKDHNWGEIGLFHSEPSFLRFYLVLKPPP